MSGMRMPAQIAATIAAAALLPLWPLGCSAADHRDPPGADGAECESAYPRQRDSRYVLPYAIGASFLIGQGNCNGADDSHAAGTADEFAYDFDMPIGTNVVAARAGRVDAVEESYRDATRISGQENFVTIQHDDGTVASYFHLTRDGALVEVGALVAQGEAIAESGDSGDSTEPHLHFQVDAADGEGSIPVVFRNTRPHPAGLVEEQTYRAEPF